MRTLIRLAAAALLTGCVGQTSSVEPNGGTTPDGSTPVDSGGSSEDGGTGASPDGAVVEDVAAPDAADSAGPPLGPLGPTPYRSFDDSPFKGVGFTYFFLEDFEDHLLDTPGVSGNGISAMSYGSLIDSVDGDDGDATDGKCAKAGNCDDWFNGAGSEGITFTFDGTALGGLPTHVGLVWTDGAGQVTWEVFDADAKSIGKIGPVSDATFPDNSFTGGVLEDRFFGFVSAGGIGSIKMSNSSGGIEVDHLQYGRR